MAFLLSIFPIATPSLILPNGQQVRIGNQEFFHASIGGRPCSGFGDAPHRSGSFHLRGSAREVNSPLGEPSRVRDFPALLGRFGEMVR